MSLFIISNLPFFLQRWDLLPSINDSIVRLKFYRYGLLNLTSPDQFWIFFLTVVARRVSLVIFVPDATSWTIMLIHTLGSLTMSTKLFDFFILEYPCWCSYRCLVITLMAMFVHIALALRLKLKIWKYLHYYFQVYALISRPLFLVAFWKVQDCVMKEEEFEYLKE
jgi:hypothetical protein